jgi:hypothetical protein
MPADDGTGGTGHASRKPSAKTARAMPSDDVAGRRLRADALELLVRLMTVNSGPPGGNAFNENTCCLLSRPSHNAVNPAM